MRNVQPALATLINSGIFQFAHIYTITLFGSIGGVTAIRLTDAPLDVTLGRLWRPTDLAGLVAWYDASQQVFSDAGVTPANNGGTVQQWNDLSGNRAHLTISPASAVLFSSTGLNGNPTVNFTGSGGFKSADVVKIGGPTMSGFMALNSGTPAASHRLLGYTDDTSLDGNDWTSVVSGILAYTNGPTNITSFRNSNAVATSNSFTANTNFRVGSIYDGVNSTLYLNNSSVASAASTGSFGVNGRINVGTNQPSDPEFPAAKMSEIIVTNTAVSAADRATIDQYLNYKWFGVGSPPTIGTTSLLYSASGVRVDQRANKRLAHWKRGLDVDQAVLVLAPRTTDPLTGAAFPDTIGSVPFIEAARGGALDGADVQIDRVFFPSWPQTGPILPFGSITIFAGTPAEVDTNDSMVVLTLNDYRQLLQNKFPRNFYQLGCTHTLYDAGCTLLPSNFENQTHVAAGSTRQTIIATDVLGTLGSGTFTLGKLTFTSGLNSGFSRTVRLWTPPSTLQLLNPMPFTVNVGDAFNVFAGCDKQLSTCQAFANQANFDGDPFIPDATTAA